MKVYPRHVQFDAFQVALPGNDYDKLTGPEWYKDAFISPTPGTEGILYWDFPGGGRSRLNVRTRYGVLSTYPGGYIVKSTDGQLFPFEHDEFHRAYTHESINVVQEEFPMPAGALVEVKWTDSVTSEDAWMSTDDVENLHAAHIKTVGYVIRHTDMEIVLESCHVNYPDGLRPHGGINVIPVCSVATFRVLEMPASCASKGGTQSPHDGESPHGT